MRTFEISTSFWEPITLSLQVSIAATAIAFVVGLLVAWRMSAASFYGKTLVETVFLLPLVLPPSVVGFILLVVLGKNSWIGQAADRLFNISFVFQPLGAIVAAAVVSFPLIYQTLKSGFLEVDKHLKDAARSQGAGEWQVLIYIVLPLASRSLQAAFILGFARALGEFGATMMIAGNIPGRTQTIPTAIYFAVDAGNLQLAWALTGCTILLSFGLLLISSRLRND
ncbi:molybdate ABC transporter permease subunit [Paenibacillus phoenicis]|uniref:Molybdenum transport system permease n=1 Tax=Paenibacillus phoenicis TaxID=554117 RepID=A0ABU5PIN4_9BACL|nr:MULTISPECIES: molybdate ABC transporter permease subunit [Paenibacillus]EES72118.1 molybdate ABC transporter, permease protein [Paenibacillus sp. oral taxon 786 str. D14]MEA3569808.1 molybdate ABC transporter permease subunit [Paenibacillus phoenicis]